MNDSGAALNAAGFRLLPGDRERTVTTECPSMTRAVSSAPRHTLAEAYAVRSQSGAIECLHDERTQRSAEHAPMHRLTVCHACTLWPSSCTFTV